MVTEYATEKEWLEAMDKCRFTLTNAMGARCDTHGRACPRLWSMPRFRDNDEPWTIPQESSK